MLCIFYMVKVDNRKKFFLEVLNIKASEKSSVLAMELYTDKFVEYNDLIADELEALKVYSWEGIVMSSADGVVRIYGLKHVGYGEMLMFNPKTSKVLGLAMNLESSGVVAVIFGDNHLVSQGDVVKGLDQPLGIKVGYDTLGRVIDAMGIPVDGKGDIREPYQSWVKFAEVERKAPGIIERKPVRDPLLTGVKAVDSLLPIGKGQRELVIGDRGTGKTALCTTAILNQLKYHRFYELRVRCIYVGVGQKGSTIRRLVSLLENKGALEYCTVVRTISSDSAPAQYIAPYSGAALGEFFRDGQQHVLMIYDDLSKHANAYRQLSLLLRRPPGREAYPGDVFYLHSRLLERASQMSDEYGGGSMTALPIVETHANDVSTYIPTNVISITDGQIFLETDLFNRNFRPAINTGLSVSRVGSSAQHRTIKELAKSIKLEITQYREKLEFAKLGGGVDSDSPEMIMGARVEEMLKQKVHTPYNPVSISIVLFTTLRRYANDISLANFAIFENGLLNFCHNSALFKLTMVNMEWGITNYFGVSDFDFEEKAYHLMIRSYKLLLEIKTGVFDVPLVGNRLDLRSYFSKDDWRDRVVPVALEKYKSWTSKGLFDFTNEINLMASNVYSVLYPEYSLGFKLYDNNEVTPKKGLWKKSN